MASAFYVLPENLFSRDSTVGQALSRITFALEQNGYVERSFFLTEVGGVAMVTRLERINEDGSSFSGKDRWPSSLNGAKLDSARNLIEILRGLFFVDRGHYRIIVFIIQEPSFEQSNRRLTEEEARALLHSGANVLPQEVAARPYDESHCIILVYEFASDGTLTRLVESRLTGRDHLEKAGILSLLESTK
jgi:hypothetical protein